MSASKSSDRYKIFNFNSLCDNEHSRNRHLGQNLRISYLCFAIICWYLGFPLYNISLPFIDTFRS